MGDLYGTGLSRNDADDIGHSAEEERWERQEGLPIAEKHLKELAEDRFSVRRVLKPWAAALLRKELARLRNRIEKLESPDA